MPARQSKQNRVVKAMYTVPDLCGNATLQCNDSRAEAKLTHCLCHLLFHRKSARIFHILLSSPCRLICVKIDVYLAYRWQLKIWLKRKEDLIVHNFGYLHGYREDTNFSSSRKHAKLDWALDGELIVWSSFKLVLYCPPFTALYHSGNIENWREVQFE